MMAAISNFFNRLLFDYSAGKYHPHLIFLASVTGLCLGLFFPYLAGAAVLTGFFTGLVAGLACYVITNLFAAAFRRIYPRLRINHSIEQQILDDAQKELKNYSNRLKNPKANHRKEAQELVEKIQNNEISSYVDLLHHIEPHLERIKQGRFIAILRRIQKKLCKYNVYNFENNSLLELVFKHYPNEFNGFYRAYLLALKQAAFEVSLEFLPSLSSERQQILADELMKHILEEKDWLMVKRILVSGYSPRIGHGVFQYQLRYILKQHPESLIQILEGLLSRKFFSMVSRLINMTEEPENMSEIRRQHIKEIIQKLPAEEQKKINCDLKFPVGVRNINLLTKSSDQRSAPTAIKVTPFPSPTSRGLSAGSSDVERFMDPADKPRDVGSLNLIAVRPVPVTPNAAIINCSSGFFANKSPDSNGSHHDVAESSCAPKQR